jgi:hypothetical protein
MTLKASNNGSTTIITTTTTAADINDTNANNNNEPQQVEKGQDISGMFEEFDQLPTSRFKPTNYNPFQIKHRKRTTSEQFDVLEHVFKSNVRPGMEIRKELAGRLDMTCRAVQVWFQNRRAKLKNKRTTIHRHGVGGTLGGGRSCLTPMASSFETSPISQIIIKSRTCLKGSKRPPISSAANELMGKIKLSGRVQSCPDIGMHFEHLKDAIRSQVPRRNTSSPMMHDPSSSELFMLPYSMMFSHHHQPSMAVMAPMTPDSLAMEELAYLSPIGDYCFPNMTTTTTNSATTFNIPSIHHQTNPFSDCCLVGDEYVPNAGLMSGNMLFNGSSVQDYDNYANYPFLFSGC